MKRERLFACLCGGLLAFCLALGATACMVTGFSLKASLPALGLGCFFISAVLAACYYFGKKRLVCFCVLLSLLYLIFNDGFLAQAGDLLAHILDYYDRAYGVAIPEFLMELEAGSHLMPLLVIGGVISALCCRTVCRAKGAAVTVLVACLPLAACLVVTDTVPQAPWLYLLLFGLSLLILTQTLRRRSPRQAPKLTALLALPLAAALALLLVLVPQDSDPGQDIGHYLDAITLWLEDTFPRISTDSQGGLVIDFGEELSQEVDLRSQGSRRERNTTVMKVTATFSDTLYLRGRSYAIYDGWTWLGSEELEEQEERFSLSDIWLTDSKNTVTVETVDVSRSLYLPYYPSGTQTLLDGRADNTTGATLYTLDVKLLMPGWRNTWKAIYGSWYAPDTGHDLMDSALSATVYEEIVPDKVIVSVIPGVDAVDAVYTELPEQTRQRAREILNDSVLSGNAADPMEVAKEIGNYVRASAEYDLNPGKMPDSAEDFALWFLEESDKGYCVHFASAAVVLLRAAGIPARYVEGYMTQVEGGQTVAVREKMSHAWVEYFLPGLGWLVMDPTPADESSPTETTEAPTQPPTEATEAPTGPTDPTEPRDTQPSQTPTATEPDRAKTQEAPKWLRTLLTWLAALTAAAAAVWGQWRLRRARITKAQRKGRNNARALARWRETARLCRLLKRRPPEELRALAEKARFSQHTLTSQELAQFTLAQQELVRQMQDRPWYLRLVYRLIFAAY